MPHNFEEEEEEEEEEEKKKKKKKTYGFRMTRWYNARLMI